MGGRYGSDMPLVCSFEVETNGNSIKVLKVILEDVDDVDNNFLIDSIEEEYYDDLTMVSCRDALTRNEH